MSNPLVIAAAAFLGAGSIACAPGGPRFERRSDSWRVEDRPFRIVETAGGRSMPEGWVLANYVPYDGTLRKERGDSPDLVYRRAHDCVPLEGEITHRQRLSLRSVVPPRIVQFPNAEAIEATFDQVTATGEAQARVNAVWIRPRSRPILLMVVYQAPSASFDEGAAEAKGLLQRLVVE